jgi:2-oxoisovalerate dehydrogenase E1 component
MDLNTSTSAAQEPGAGPSGGVPRDRWADAFLIRVFEQRLLELFAQGALFGTVHTCIGQELNAVAVAHALRADDLVLSNHRCHGHYLARSGDVVGLMAEVMGRASGVCGGRGGSQHICAHGVLSNGIQGGMTPVAAGLALARKLRGSSDIVVVFIGDGTLGEGVVYETLNIASRWELPLAIVLENNLYAQSTHQSQTLAGDICRRADAFGIHSFTAAIWEPEALFRTSAEALAYVRQQGRPVFLRLDAYRLAAHSKGDDDRDPEELRRYRAIDPLACYAGLHPDDAAFFEEQAVGRVRAAFEEASAAPFTQPTPPPQYPQAHAEWRPTRMTTDERIVNRIHAALRDNMQRDPRIVCLGEDIEAPYGGAFKVTKDLSLLFPGRVRNTPISEAAIMGLAGGLAIGGLRPVVEIMFGDFLALAADQFINHAAKFRYMYNDQVSVPLIVRAAAGGKRGYGPTHSQCLEKHLLGVPDTRVLALHHRYDAALVYDRLFETIDRPTLVIEHKSLYGLHLSDEAPAGFTWEHGDGCFPAARLRPASPPDLTIVCYGGVLVDVERAVERLFDEHEIVAEAVCLLELYPLDLAPVVASTAVSGRLLVVEEGQVFCGFGAEVLAALSERPEARACRSRRLGATAWPLPASRPAELQMLPSVESIVIAALELAHE